MHQRDDENLVIGIAWIGHTLDPHYAPHRKIIDEKVSFKEKNDAEASSIGCDDSDIYPWFELTYLGEPICMNEHLCELSAGERINVLQLDDFQSDLGLKITKEYVQAERSGQ